MFLNKCLLFKEIQLYLEQFCTCKERTRAAGRGISPPEHLQGFPIKTEQLWALFLSLSIITVGEESMSQVSGKHIIMLNNDVS